MNAELLTVVRSYKPCNFFCLQTEHTHLLEILKASVLTCLEVLNHKKNKAHRVPVAWHLFSTLQCVTTKCLHSLILPLLYVPPSPFTPISPREKACRYSNTFTQDAIRDTAALRATFVSFLIKGWH